MNGVTPLPQLGVIRVEGEDAANFLQGQLTQDFTLLGMGEARFAAFCSAKGRMLASFVGFKRGPAEIILVLNRDTLATTLKRLSMFVLRAKARLSDASADFSLYGLTGDTLQAMVVTSREPWSRSDIGPATVVQLYPADGTPRALWVAPAGTPAPAGPALTQEAWLWAEVRSVVASVSAPIVEAFVPQMLNYESLGGVNFKKGCYPGQEVVARSQFRGTLKRRAYLVHGAVELRAGQEVFHDGDLGQPCGLVAQAAAAPAGGWDAIVSIQVAAASGGRLTVSGPSGAALEVQPLPYRLLADV